MIMIRDRCDPNTVSTGIALVHTGFPLMDDRLHALSNCFMSEIYIYIYLFVK